MTVISMLIIMMASFGEINKMHNRDVSVFSYSPKGATESSLNLTNYLDSFNMIIALEGAEDFNWFDNPYISATIYEPRMDKNDLPKKDSTGTIIV